MPRFVPTPVWKDEPAYIVGGGPSLRGFDWNLLHGKHVIGCNQASILGDDVCEIVCFGDMKLFLNFQTELSQFKGMVVTNVPALLNSELPWLYTMRRELLGLHHDALGWNHNTGAVAINLALLLGANPVYLLGYDMQRSKQLHWHDYDLEQTTDQTFARHANGLGNIARELEAKFPGHRVVNVTDGSKLDCFPKISLAEHFGDSYAVPAGTGADAVSGQ